MIEQLVAEATECAFKVALEIKKPKSWLKSVSAFANGIGGTLFFGINDDRAAIGLQEIQKDAEIISRLIKERITPLPQFVLTPFRERTGLNMELSDYVSFGLADKNGFLTNAGKLLADQHIVFNSRIFCTRWNGIERGSIFDDALDDKEYEGNLIYLLKNGSEFIRNNSKTRFIKEAQYRVDKPDYAERAVTEAVVNALIHRDYILSWEVKYT